MLTIYDSIFKDTTFSPWIVYTFANMCVLVDGKVCSEDTSSDLSTLSQDEELVTEIRKNNLILITSLL